MISFMILSIILILLMLTIILYLNVSYYSNLFILYRNSSNITSKSSEDVDRILTIDEVFNMIKNLILNKI
ncbi:hypothetical protein PmNV_051 [Penaeus monodon nudivirus]|uniref:Uncharacterized protein n=1 Tax=Penaeus monodon nudivirus TaxID=1529056 RepID=A0A076FEQ2_9VIRU|nr:hypothetical protein PmNV_051 [Penaeus monodon nudivirus]AII15839.1 hypothetical protein PmNV_051 [Penaeus monodon nudivirus]